VLVLVLVLLLLLLLLEPPTTKAMCLLAFLQV
jgi:hypothetical protein